MDLKHTRLHILHEAENLTPKAKTGVSLHCHTEYSREMLDFVPQNSRMTSTTAEARL